MSDRNLALRIIAIMAFMGIVLAVLVGCQGAPVTKGKGPKVMFFSSQT